MCSKFSDFAVGDKVHHKSRRSDGIVERLVDNEGKPAVVIRFEDWPDRTSGFGPEWFPICGHLLIKVPR